MHKTTALFLAAFIFTSPAQAHDYSIGALSVVHPMVFETPASGRSAGGYLTIENSSDMADRLIEVRADFPRVMIHNSVMEDDIAKMIHLESLEIPAGGAIALEPGGLHIMFMGLSAPFEDGDKFDATLVFETAGELEVTFNVEERPALDAVDHSDHEMDDSN